MPRKKKTIIDISAQQDEPSYYIPMFAVLHHVLNAPGLPAGHCILSWAESQAGKTLLALLASVRCLRMGGAVRFANTEKAPLNSLLKLLGLDEDERKRLEDDGLWYPEEPDTIESTVKWIMEETSQLRDENPDPEVPILGVWDSVAATESKEEAAKDLEDNAKVASHGLSMSRSTRKLRKSIRKSGSVCLVTNQVRSAIDPTGMRKDTRAMPHGKALYFYMDTVFWLQSAAGIFQEAKLAAVPGRKSLRRKNDRIGTQVVCLGEKARGGPAHRTVEWNFTYNSGIDYNEATLFFLAQRGLIKHSTVKGKKEFRYGKISHRFWKHFVRLFDKKPKTLAKLEKFVMEWNDEIDSKK